MKDSKYIDHTVLKAVATKEDIVNLCNEAIANDFKSVCVNPCWVSLCRDLLRGSDVLVCTVIGFPLGANDTEVKAFEAKKAIRDGAQEIDMVINIGRAKMQDYNYIYKDIKAVKEACGNVLLKVIIETCYLTNEEKKEVCLKAVEAKAEYVKTSTGFGTGGATVEDVTLMSNTVNGNALVKASGGVRCREDFDNVVKAGASRIGTSNGVSLMDKENNNDKNSNSSY